jgi:hypothetical protein
MAPCEGCNSSESTRSPVWRTWSSPGRHTECLRQIRDAEHTLQERLAALAVKPHDDATIVSARVMPSATSA